MLRTRMITRLAHRSLDWSGIQKKLSDPKARAALDSLRQAHSQIEQDAKKYMAPPAPINFAEYREKIKTKGLVDVFESDYNALQFEELNAADFMDEGAAETAAMVRYLCFIYRFLIELDHCGTRTFGGISTSY